MTTYPHTERLRTAKLAVAETIKEQINVLRDLPIEESAKIVFSSLMNVAYDIARQNDMEPLLLAGLEAWTRRMADGTMNELRIDEGGA